MRAFLYKDAEDWEYHVKKLVSPRYRKVNKYISIALNILVPALLLFVFKLSFPAFIIAFLIFDVAMVAVEYLSIWIYRSGLSLKWVVSRGKFKKNIQNMSAQELSELKNEMKQSTDFYKEKIQMLNEQIEEYKKAAIAPKDKESIKYIEEVVGKIILYTDSSDDEAITAKMRNIVEYSQKLVDIIKNEPDEGVRVISVFNVYAEELLKILNQYDTLDDEAKDEKRPKVERLLDTFGKKLTELEEKITSGKEQSLDFDIEFLEKRLNNER